MKKILILLLATSLLAACSSKEEKHDHAHEGHEASAHRADHWDPQTRELMAAHDSLMAQMGTLNSLKQKLEKQSETLEKGKKEEAEKLAANLKSADNKMMDWMHQYKADTLEKLSEQQIRQYVSGQMQQIQSVKNEMHHAISEASVFLEKHPVTE